MGLIRRLLPSRAVDSLKVLLGRASIDVPRPDEATPFSCPVCAHVNARFDALPMMYFRELDRHQFVHSIFQFETLNLEFYSCSACGACDRDRLYALYLQQRLDAASPPLALLDVAPAPALQQFLSGFPAVQIRTADLYMADVDDRVDLMDMHQYRDAQFDVFICSHVLEHVPDDRRAMKELHRVLKPGGFGIAMVPIHLGLSEISENPAIEDEGDRWKYFGQNDHVRLYSKQGFIERLEATGFRVEQLDERCFGAAAFARHGIHPRSVLYVVHR